MKEETSPQPPSEREREADRLFLEYAVRKCALTLSKNEILSRTERILTEYSERQVDEILLEYGEKSAVRRIDAETMSFLSKADAQKSEGSSPPAKSRDTPAKPPPEETGQNAAKQRKKKKSLVGDLLFYGILAALIVGVVLLTGSSGQGPRSFAGFTAQTVLTSSMESVYPKGALVISRRTDANTLKIGDDITFMSSETATITHRIIGIVEDYADTGQRAFQTQGVMNKNPDSQLVPAVNVVGKVVFHSHAAGKVVDFLKSYWPLLLFFFVLLAVLVRVLRYIYRKDDKDSDQAEKQEKPKAKPQAGNPRKSDSSYESENHRRTINDSQKEKDADRGGSSGDGRRGWVGRNLRLAIHQPAGAQRGGRYR